VNQAGNLVPLDPEIRGRE